MNVKIHGRESRGIALRINAMLTIDRITMTAGSIRARRDIAGYKEILVKSKGDMVFSLDTMSISSTQIKANIKEQGIFERSFRDTSTFADGI